MKKKDKPLPKPPKTPFGRKRAGEEEQGGELLADKMAEAAALGNLDRFLERELPDSEHARALANMMMGMTGMPPQGAARPPDGTPEDAPEPSAGQTGEMPPGVREAVQAGDIQGLIDRLRQEQEKRSGVGEAPAAAGPGPGDAPQDEPPSREREVLDRLISLAREHNVSPDWIIQRALKLYFEEYRRTGRL